ncbi:hypothetical protein A2V71_03445 [Candidatus Berkelbacteria bacterium RBG_13_40_8]|uniref:Zn-dependent hydrolase n=1 Tax=Candidatus Berkelbacteria bacterium RBG_13_40_8 TaxID=1797467 RepID=A0A1F5DQY4_9BACT|nr:MAG: hypothetical protein A2V71_03445 [Candidatus Berkelbacteria bacterium RBG_13_40_8]
MKTFSLDGIEVTLLHHAAVKIKAQKLVIYIDPYQVADEQADLILITHDHFDHFDTGSILKLQKPGTKVIGPEILKGKIAGDLKTLKPGDAAEALGVKIATIPSYNLTSPNHPKEKGYLGYVLDIVGKRIYVSGDTDKIPEMIALKDIDLAFLPIAGPMMHEEEAASAVKEFKPKIVVPYHCGEVVSGGDPEKFAALVGDTAKAVILD